jgi:RNA polymerase sigma factor (sigma-70 family)
MEESATPVGMESLLQHREWVRRVARALVSDENLADDLEQEVWLDALQRPPRSSESPRGWLATALRHNLVDLRRSEAGRRRREESRARPEAQGPGDVVAEAEGHRRLVVAVMDLPEPWRTTLLHRYFQDLPLAEAARREGAPLETVRTRVRRGLAILRERLDAEQGGDRGAWVTALLPLTAGGAAAKGTGAMAGAGASTALKWGGLLVQTLSKIAVAAGVVAVGGVLLWALSRGPVGPSAVEEARIARPAAARPAEIPPGTAPAPRSAPPATAPAPPAAPSSGAAAPVKDVPAAVPAVAEATPAAVAPPSPAPAPARAFQGEVSGRVLLLSDRSPVGGATVVLQRKWNPAEAVPKEAVPKEAAPREEPQTLVTDASGAFRFQSVPPGTFEVRASFQGFAPRTLPAVVMDETAAGAAGLEALLVKGGAVEGVVFDERGSPAEGVTVRAHRSDTPPQSAEATTGADGRYRFENLTAGSWRVEAVRGEGRIQSVVVAVAEGGTAKADFRSGASISGTLVDAEGSVLPGAIVRARPKDMKGGYTSRDTRTDDAGAFTIADLQPGEWVVSVQVLGEVAFAGDITTVKVGADPVTVALRLERGEIAGRVTVKATGKPVERMGAQLSLYPLARGQDGKWRMAGNSSFMAFLDAEGRYRFRGLAPGRYRLAVYPREKGLRKFEKEIDLRAGERMDGVDVALEEMKTGTVRFTVRDASGSALEGVLFSTGQPDGSSLTFNPEAAEPGVYVATLEAGKHTVHCYRKDAGSAEATVEVKEGKEIQAAMVLKPPR